MPKYFVYGEDMAAALVGPFQTVEAALAHVSFCEARGDADPGRVVDEVEAESFGDIFRMTPEDDRVFADWLP